MRYIKYIVLHCTATQPTTKISVIQNYWRDNLHWKNPGYHYIITVDGTIMPLLDESLVANGVAGYNKESIHVSYIGGVDVNNVPEDTRTFQQKESMKVLIGKLKLKYPNAIIQGHRDFPNVHKACPSFDVKEWLKLLLV
jgi:N-acetylmuramoyl-L-alanine amidase